MKLKRYQAKTLAAAGVVLSTSLVLAGCSTGGTDDPGVPGAPGASTEVPIGGSAEEYAAALADMKETTLVYQIGGGPEATTSVTVKDFAKNVEEYSGGKIKLDLAWSNAIIPNTAEIDRGLLDGRVDIGVVYYSYNAEDYPISNSLISATVLRDPRLLAGTLGSAAAYEEVILGTAEAMAEFTDQGLTPLYVMQPETPIVMHCREPLTSLASLQGKQIRAATPAMATQLEGLGAVPVSMAYNEVYEALQRGILDCAMGIHALATSTGWAEVAPNILHTSGDAAFVSTPTPYFAGVNFLSMPEVAQQLVIEMFVRSMAETKEIQVGDIVNDVLATAEKNGGGFHTFDDDVSAKLREINDKLLDDIRNSSLFDGKAYLERLETAQDKWKNKVEELGYEDIGEADDMADWYKDDLGSGYVDVLIDGIAPLTFGARP